jgi:hypothetical protein
MYGYQMAEVLSRKEQATSTFQAVALTKQQQRSAKSKRYFQRNLEGGFVLA